MKKTNQKLALSLIVLIVISSFLFAPQIVRAEAITFTCTASLTPDNLGVSQTSRYELNITNTGSAKMGYANFTIPRGFSNLSPVTVTTTASGQVWTATILAQPSMTQNGTVVLQGSAQGLSTNEKISVTFTIKNPPIAKNYQWVIYANQNTGAGGHDYQIFTIFFDEMITPAVTTQLSIYPSSTMTAGSTIYDTAKLTGATVDATGTVTYTLYKGIFPTGIEVYHSDVTITSSNLPNVSNSAVSPILDQAGPYYYMATYSGDLNNVPASGIPEIFTVTAADMTSLHFATIPSPQIAGNPFIITITAQDQYGNTVESYGETVGFSTSVGISPVTATLTNGAWSNQVTINTAAFGVTISASDASGKSGTSNAFDVNPVPQLKLVYTAGAVQTLNAGKISSTVTVQLRDANNNPVATGTTVSLTSTSNRGEFYSDSVGNNKITSMIIPSGQSSASFYYSDTKAGSPTIIASAQDANSAVTQFTINPAITGATQLVVSAPDFTTAGESFEAIVTAKDTYGNTVANYAGTVHVTTTDEQAILPSDSALTNGVKTFELTLKTAGTQTLTATDKLNPAISGSTSINVIADLDGLTSIVISPSTATISAGSTQSFSAQSLDAYGNVIEDITSQATWSIDANAAGSWNSATYTSQKVGTWTVTATLSSLSDTAGLTVTTSAALLDHIVISPKTATINAGESQSFSVEAFDAYGNSLGQVTNSAVLTAPGATVTGNSVSASSAGSYTVTATYNGKSDTATLAVTEAPTPTPSPSPSPSPSPTATPTQNTNPTPTPTSKPAATTYTVTFKEQGLPDGKLWNVTFNGQTKASVTNTITYTGIVAGQYSWSIGGILTQGLATRYVANQSSGTIKVSSAANLALNYKTQYYLTVNSEIGNPIGQGWYDQGAAATFNVDQQATDQSGTQYAFAGWQGIGTGSYTGVESTQTITMNNPVTETPKWEQATSLYTVAGSALLVLLLLLLALLLVWRRRKKKTQQFPVKELDA